MEDFVCPACGGGLPGFPVHGRDNTYCSAHCRDWAEGAPADDDDEVED